MGEDTIEYELKSYIKIGGVFWTAMIINGKNCYYKTDTKTLL